MERILIRVTFHGRNLQKLLESGNKVLYINFEQRNDAEYDESR